jgi:hypothetical protein
MSDSAKDSKAAAPAGHKPVDSVQSSFSPVTDRVPKFHQVVEAKAPGEKPVLCRRKPEGWYADADGRILSFTPKEFKPAAAG